MSPLITQGKTGENIASFFLQRKGYDIITRNFHSRYGELDVVAFKEDTIVFVEVKLRRGGCDEAFSSVSQAKKRKLVRTAVVFLQKYPQYENYMTRFDVVAVIESRIAGEYLVKHLPGAFFAGDVDCRL